MYFLREMIAYHYLHRNILQFSVLYSEGSPGPLETVIHVSFSDLQSVFHSFYCVVYSTQNAIDVDLQ